MGDYLKDKKNEEFLEFIKTQSDLDTFDIYLRSGKSFMIRWKYNDFLDMISRAMMADQDWIAFKERVIRVSEIEAVCVRGREDFGTDLAKYCEKHR